MEALLKQVRSKRSGKEEISSIREGRTPPERTPSFKGERRAQKWFKRQFSRQMSFQTSEDTGYAAAVAAAAFAITALESDAVDQRIPDLERRPSLPRIRSEMINAPARTAQQDQVPNRYAGDNNDETTEMVPEKTIHPVPSIKRNPTMLKKRLTFADELAEAARKHSIERDPSSFGKEPWEDTERRKPVERNPPLGEKQMEDTKRKNPMFSTPSFKRTPSTKRTPSFGEEWFEETKRTKSPKGQAPQYPHPILPPPIPPPPAVPPLNIQSPAIPQRAQRPRGQETDADSWEREQMAKIKRRYEKLNATILDWEDKKKKKARRQLEKTEVRITANQDSTCDKYQKVILKKICLQEPQSDQHKRRTRAMQNYQIEMERIKEIADGARAQAKAKQRNEELKVIEKANKYRATGEPPMAPACLCL